MFNMEITNKNTFTEEEVFFDKEKGLVYIGKSAYQINELERVVANYKMKDFNESLNYRVISYSRNKLHKT